MSIVTMNTPHARRTSLRSLLLAASVPALALLGSTGCGPGILRTAELTPAEQQVRILEQGQSPLCTLYEERGTIEAESSLSPPSAAYESTLNRLRRAAAERGATSVQLQAHSQRNGLDYAKGVAIRCLPRPEVAPPAAPTPAPEAPSSSPAAPAR